MSHKINMYGCTNHPTVKGICLPTRTKDMQLSNNLISSNSLWIMSRPNK
jgi:hypothetical protein